MKTNRTQKLTSLLLTFAMIVSMLMVSVSAATTGVKLEFVYPESVKSEEVHISVYNGFPIKSGVKYIEKLEEVPANENGEFVLDTAGTYSYWVQGEGYYSVCKIFNVSAEDVKTGVKKIEVETAPMAGNGYEPTNAKVENAPEDYTQDSRDQVILMLPDEILKHFTTEDLVGYKEFKTPFFTKKHADHQVTTDEQMNAFVKEQDNSCDFMHLYSMGLSPVYKFNMPVALFTETKIPANATFDEAVKLAKSNGKINILIQAQVHSNEPAAGEGALALIDDLTGDYGLETIKNANVVVIPRINPEGGYLFRRYNYFGRDMNRDHMVAESTEIANIHRVYQSMMPEVVMDGHEFTYHIAGTDGFMKNSDDVESTPATSLNINPEITKLALDMADSMHTNFKNSGLRSFHYSYTVNNPIGRAYYGLYNSISFLVETRGIGAGTANYARRVFSQEVAARSIIDFAIAHSEEIRTTVAAAREKVIDLGATYDEDDILVLHQVASGNTLSPSLLTSYQYNIDGITETKSKTEKLSLNDTVVRSRPRPTAYVLPADLENIDTILYIMKDKGIEYYKLEPGSTAELQQYFYVGPYNYESTDKGFTADLREPAMVTFDQGAYVFPMDQWSGNVLGMLMEPDVNDSDGYDGTLVQYKMFTYDEETKNFPMYRYIGDNPRETLVSNVFEMPFKDVKENDWYYEGVRVTTAMGLFKGVTEDMFGPKINLTRAMLAQILYADAGKPEIDFDAGYTDVPEDTWYTDAVNWVTKMGIAIGYGDGRFGPEDAITREQLATMLFGEEGKPDPEYELKFDDVDQIADWAVDAMTWAVHYGVMEGIGNNLLAPKSIATRAEAAVILMQCLK